MERDYLEDEFLSVSLSRLLLDKVSEGLARDLTGGQRKSKIISFPMFF